MPEHLVFPASCTDLEERAFWRAPLFFDIVNLKHILVDAELARIRSPKKTTRAHVLRQSFMGSPLSS
jgi:hypothetical protein